MVCAPFVFYICQNLGQQKPSLEPVRCPHAPLSSFSLFKPLLLHPTAVKMREVISIHIGQAGIQVGNACWELYCLGKYLVIGSSEKATVARTDPPLERHFLSLAFVVNASGL